MNRLSLALVVALAACGGSTKAAPTANAGGTAVAPVAVPAPWARVLVEGAVFKLANDRPDRAAGDEAAVTITGTVRDVQTQGDATSATIAWTRADGSPVSGPPTRVKVSPAGVWFDNDGSLEATPTFPAGAVETERAGYQNYARVDGAAVCYGEGPGPDAPDCEDVCFAELCVSADHGIVAGSGTWWPNYELYEAIL